MLKSPSLSVPIAVKSIVYHAVIPPEGGASNLGKSGSLFVPVSQSFAMFGLMTDARAKPTKSTAPHSSDFTA